LKAPWFIACTLCLTLLAPLPAEADGHITKTDVFASAATFAHAMTEGVRYDKRTGGFRLQDDPAGGVVRSGRFTLGDLHYGSGFDRAVASWNADCPPGTSVMVELQTSPDGGGSWSTWYEIARWGDPELANQPPKSARVKSDPMGKVDEDTLELVKKADRLRCRVTLSTIHREVSPLVSLVAVSVFDNASKVPPDNTPGPSWGHEVQADFRSQGAENADLSYRVCGPTSTGMMLTSHGVKLPTARVAEACWDELNGIYGNWPFIAAGASALMRRNAELMPSKPGHPKVFRSFVSFAPDWKDVEAEIAAGNPCVVSIHYKQGELKGSPTSASDGHLILVRGFTRTGDVVVNDPAAKTPAKGRLVYNRQQLHAARHGGPIIIFRPYE
jgi:hypothetical protein